jgi:deoxyribodipyrimidine photolyase-related protein
MKHATLVFPHQLFRHNPALMPGSPVFLVEEQLFFRQYRFHKQKIRFHRASMKFYEAFLLEAGFEVVYIESGDPLSDVRTLIASLESDGYDRFRVCDVVDDWLAGRIRGSITAAAIEDFESPAFLNDRNEVREYFGRRKRYFQTDFYTLQRKKLGILLNPDFTPVGGKWSFDAENRKRYPKGKTPPKVDFPASDALDSEACDYVSRHFADNYGELSESFRYPATFDAAESWFTCFLETRFAEFGGYEDAIVAREHILNHSLLSPLLNSGLLTPAEVVGRTVEFAALNDVPLNSVEGFIRQIIGWREFIRGVYETAGRKERTNNHWGFKRKIPKSFWTGTTGIEPIDTVVRKTLETGYCHHIERLMVLGNFMLLCEFDPDEVYLWFMEMFIDAYDWVMVPNVYGMSQFADGGLFATKPYISGSNYLGKMTDFPKGDWQEVWDALFWRFMDVHRAFFLRNPRLSMLVRTFDKMPPEKRLGLIEKAERYLSTL